MPAITLKPFYEQKRASLPEGISSVLTANQVRVGAGTDTFAVGSGGFIFRSALSTSTVTGFGNGTELVNQVKVTNTANKNIIAIVERAVYIGSKAGANLLPGGSSIDESQFQVIGNGFSVIDTSGTTVGTNQLASHLYIRNISAGTITVIIDAYVRYVVNQT